MCAWAMGSARVILYLLLNPDTVRLEALVAPARTVRPAHMVTALNSV